MARRNATCCLDLPRRDPRAAVNLNLWALFKLFQATNSDSKYLGGAGLFFHTAPSIQWGHICSKFFPWTSPWLFCSPKTICPWFVFQQLVPFPIWHPSVTFAVKTLTGRTGNWGNLVRHPPHLIGTQNTRFQCNIQNRHLRDGRETKVILLDIRLTSNPQLGTKY